MRTFLKAIQAPFRAMGFCRSALLFLLSLGALQSMGSFADELEAKGKAFNIWLASDPHVTVDTLHGVETLRLAFRQSEGF